MNEMAVFVRVVETGSFSEAARQTGSTPSAISRSIARLERALKTHLLQRTTRKLRLSDSGVAVYKHCRDMVASAHAAMEISGKLSDVPEGRLHISIPRAVGQFLVHPHIPAFLAAFPLVDVILRLEDRDFDLIDERIDLAFRITDEPPSGLMGRRLMRIDHIICATPAYLAQYGTPVHPHDLKHHSCIAPGTEAMDSRWKFSLDGRTANVDVQGRYTVNDSFAILDVVLHHQGIGALPYFVARDAVHEGAVVPLLQEWTLGTNFSGDVWILYPRTRHLPPKIRSFVDFIARRLPDPAQFAR